MGLTHQDLIELGNSWVYDITNSGKYDNPIILHSGRWINVTEIKKSPSGLDAIRIIDNKTGEISVIFAGTHDGKDVWTDAQLDSNYVPQQYIDAKNYIKELERQGKHIKYLGGNSLGGGLANATVGYTKNGISVVSDPAPVPKEWNHLDPKRTYNYISKNDPLYATLKAMGLTGLVPGKKKFLKGMPIEGLNKLIQDTIDNHVGTKNDKDFGIQDIIPFSFFHNGKRIDINGYGKKVKIDKEILEELFQYMKNQAKTREIIKKDEFDHVKSDLENYQNTVGDRKETTKQLIIQDLHGNVTKAVGNVEAIHSSTKRQINSIKEKHNGLSYDARQKSSSMMFRIMDMFDGINGHIVKILNYSYDEFIMVCANTIVDKAFENEESDRSIANSLIKQHSKLNCNLILTNDRWNFIQQEVENVSKVFDSLDKSIASSFQSGSSKVNSSITSSGNWPEGDMKLMDSKYSSDIVNSVKERAGNLTQLSLAYVNVITDEFILKINTLISLLRLAIEVLGDLTTEILSFISGLENFSSKIDDAVGLKKLKQTDKEISRFFSEISSDIKRFKRNITLTLNDITDNFSRIPNVLPKLEKNIAEKVFSTGIANIIIDRYGIMKMEMDRNVGLFGEIGYQLSDNKAIAIEKLSEKSKKLKENYSEIDEAFSKLL